MSSDGYFSNLQVTGVSTLPLTSISESTAPLPQAGSVAYNLDNDTVYLSRGPGTGLGWAPLASSIPSTLGYTYSGTVSFSGATAGVLGSVTADSKAGQVARTNVTSIAAGATDVLTILDAAAGSAGLVSLQCTTVAATSAPYITSVVWTAGVSIVITIQNGGAGATGADSAFTFDFISFN